MKHAVSCMDLADHKLRNKSNAAAQHIQTAHRNYASVNGCIVSGI
jgi:hypothetical protein